MIENEKQFLDFLKNLFSGFSQWWCSEENYNISDDGGFSMAGVCAELSQYYIDSFDEFSVADKRNLFFFIELVLIASEKDASLSEMAVSVKSCFLENIARTQAGGLSAQYMGKRSRDFFELWHS